MDAKPRCKARALSAAGACPGEEGHQNRRGAACRKANCAQTQQTLPTCMHAGRWLCSAEKGSAVCMAAALAVCSGRTVRGRQGRCCAVLERGHLPKQRVPLSHSSLDHGSGLLLLELEFGLESRHVELVGQEGRRRADGGGRLFFACCWTSWERELLLKVGRLLGAGVPLGSHLQCRGGCVCLLRPCCSLFICQMLLVEGDEVLVGVVWGWGAHGGSRHGDKLMPALLPCCCAPALPCCC